MLSLVVSTITYAETTHINERVKSLAVDSVQFEERQIRALGASNLFDLLNTVPGIVSSTKTNLAGVPQLEIKGRDANNGRVLVLVNGHRLTDDSQRDFASQISGLNFQLVETIKVDLGVQSARFGNNAYAAVIDITLKQSNEIGLIIGSNNQNTFIASLNKKGSYGEIYANLAMGKQDQNNAQLANLENKQFNIGWRRGLVSLDYYYQTNELTDGVVQTFATSQNFLKNETQSLTSQYNNNFDKHTRVNINLSASQNKLDSVGPTTKGSISPFSQDYFFGPDWTTRHLRLTTELTHDGFDNLEYLAGIMWNKSNMTDSGVYTSHLNRDNQQAIPLDIYYQGSVVNVGEFEATQSLKQSIESLAFYAQFDWELNSKTNLQANIRYDEFMEQRGAFSFSIEGNHKLTDTDSLNAKIATGFVQANRPQLFGNNVATSGNNQLEPETVTSLKMNYERKKANWVGHIGVFFDRFKDIMQPEFESATTTHIYQNSGDADVSGIEIQGVNSVTETLSLSGGLIHNFKTENSWNYETLLNLNLEAHLPYVDINLVNQYRSSQKINIDENNQMFEQGAVLVSDATLSSEVGRAVFVGLTVRNLFNKKYSVFDPQLVYDRNSFRQAGRRLELTMNYRF